jgi:hypothetical protein
MNNARVPLAISYQDMMQAARTTPKTTAGDSIRAHIYLSWFPCLRSSDALQLRKANVYLYPDGKMSTLVQYSKTVRIIGSYWSHTQIADKEVLDFLLAWLPKQKGPYLFPTTTPAHHRSRTASLLQQLRTVNPRFESKGLRRGVLTEAAKNGATVSELLSMSRHKDQKTLYGYLYDVPSMDQKGAMAAFVKMAGGTREKADIQADTDLAAMAGAGGLVAILPWLKVGVDGTIVAMLDRMPKAKSSNWSHEDMLKWPLHVKLRADQRINLDRVTELTQRPGASPRVIANWKRTIEYLNDVNGLFGKVPFDGRLERANFPEEDIALLRARGNIKRLTKKELLKIRGTALLFWIGEERENERGEDASRRRVITETRAFNAFWSKLEVLWNVHSTPRKIARKQVLRGQYALALDASAQFDQMTVGDAVSFAQVFRHGRHVYRRTTASMGCRPSSDAGTSLTEVLADFDTECEIAVATDAVRFIGSYEQVLKAGIQFIERAKFCGVTFNGIDCQTATHDDIAKLIVSDDIDFLGERLNLKHKTVSCKPKHVARLVQAAADAMRPTTSYRDYLVLFGVLNYMSEVLAVRKDKFFEARLFFSNMARKLALDPSLLDQNASGEIFPKNLVDWVGLVALNTPRAVREEVPCNAGFVFDASAYGAAGIFVLPDGTHELVQHRWSDKERAEMNVHASSVSESAAARLFIAHAAERWPLLRFMALSDHDGLVLAFRNRNICCQAYNDAIATFLNSGDDHWLTYVPGPINPADYYSRHAATALSPKHAEEARALVNLAIAEQIAGKGCPVDDAAVIVNPDRGLHADHSPSEGKE